LQNRRHWSDEIEIRICEKILTITDEWDLRIKA